MKKLLLFAVTALMTGSLMAQDCTSQIDPNADSLGFNPNPLPATIQGVPYDHVNTVLIPGSVNQGGNDINLCGIKIEVVQIDTAASLATNANVAGFSYVWEVYQNGTQKGIGDQIIVNGDTRICLRLKVANPPAPNNAPDCDSIVLNVTIRGQIDLGFGCVDVPGASGTQTYPVRFPVCASTSSIEEQVLDLTNLFAAPNPAIAFTNIRFDAEQNGEAVLNVMDLTGKLIASQNLQVVSGKNVYTVNTAGLASGIYVYSITQNGKSITNKLVVGQ